MKYLTKDHTGRQSNVKWPPIGVWTTWKPIKICRSGYHVCKRDWLCLWLDAKIFEVEVQGAQCWDSQYVGHRARLTKQLVWTEEQARNYVIDCVEYLRINIKGQELYFNIDPYMAAHNISRCIKDIDWMIRRLNENIC